MKKIDKLLNIMYVILIASLFVTAICNIILAFQ